ncbi:MAG: metallophosphoesterase family protein [Deltaproteobacteria bacterium]|nr:MAG: metallophosphoesterase family protein [Deltaproteobacteria bacterium]
MKLALLGDIHGNHLALAAVLEAAAGHGAERLLVTGDLVGYYFWPREVLDLLQGWDAAVVRGNHEEMLARGLADGASLAAAEAKYGSGLRIAAEELDETRRDWLCTLPHPLELTVDGRRILLCHGSPRDLDRYVYPDASPELIGTCILPGYDLVVMGHTHYPSRWQVGETLLVNPGSVGQPRNRVPGAHWMLYDTGSGEATARHADYDAGFVVAESRRRHPGLPYLAEVLERR